MKNTRKILSIFMALILTVGAFAVPAKAAETVQFTLGTGHTVDDTAQHRYQVQLTADKTYASGNKQAVDVLIDGVQYTNPTNPLIYFYVFDATKGPSLVVYYSAIESGGGNKTAAQLNNHAITIPAGTTYQGYTLAEDFTFSLVGGEVQEGNVNGAKFSLGTEHTVDDTEQHRYQVQLTADKTYASGNKQAVNVLIDGTAYTNPDNPLIYFYVYDASKGPSVVIYYSALESGGGNKTAAQLSNHVITIPAGTVYQGYELAEDFVFTLTQGNVVAGGTVPEVPRKEIDFTLSATRGKHDGYQRYNIYLDGVTEEQGTAIHKIKTTMLLDGVEFTGQSDYYYSGGKLLLRLLYADLDSEAQTAAEIGVHTICIQAGTKIGEYEVVNDVMFSINGESVVEGDITVSLSLGDCGKHDGQQRYNIYLNGPSDEQVAQMASNQAILYIDGVKSVCSKTYYNDNGKLLLRLPYSDLDSNATTAADIGEHIIKIKKGTEIGDYIVRESLTIRINGEKIEQIASDDSNDDKVKLAVSDKTEYDDAGAFVVYLEPSDYLPGIIDETVYPMSIQIGAEAYEVSATKTDMGELTFSIPASELEDSFVLTIPGATYTSQDDVYGPISTVEYQLYVNAYGYHEDGYLASKGTNVGLTYASGDAAGIYLNATDSMSVVGSSGKATHRVEDGVSGIYYNGERSDVYLRKTAEGTWYVALGARSITAMAGDSVILTGAFITETDRIDFETLSLIYNGNTWETTVDKAVLKEESADISEDSFYIVPENTVINDGTVTGDTLYQSGDYTLKTDIGGAVCEKTVIVYKQGDINADNVVDVLDLIVFKKASLGLKTLTKSGTLASELGGENAEDQLKSLRAMYLTNYTLKADEELPVGVIGQTGSGSYITDVEATTDGTTVISAADTDSVYGVQDDAYQNIGLDYVLDFHVDRELKVLQLTDTQIIDAAQARSDDRLGASQKEKYATDNIAENVFTYIDQTVAQANPDLILITGDLVYGEFDDSGSSFLALIEYMESLKIPWAPIFGNHDNESLKGVEWQCEQLMNAQYCLFNRRHSIGGNGNYSIGLGKNGSLERVIYMMDSHACYGAADGEPVEKRTGLAGAQVQWYRSVALRVNDFAGETIPSFVCYHIPTVEVIYGGYVAGYHDAVENASNFAGSYTIGVDNTAQPGDFGKHEEKFKSAYSCAGLLDVMQEVGTDGAFFGHSHMNSISVRYGGVRWTFGLKTGEYDRYPSEMGGVLITLPQAQDNFTVQQIAIPEQV